MKEWSERVGAISDTAASVASNDDSDANVELSPLVDALDRMYSFWDMSVSEERAQLMEQEVPDSLNAFKIAEDLAYTQLAGRIVLKWAVMLNNFLTGAKDGPVLEEVRDVAGRACLLLARSLTKSTGRATLLVAQGALHVCAPWFETWAPLTRALQLLCNGQVDEVSRDRLSSIALLDWRAVAQVCKATAVDELKARHSATMPCVHAALAASAGESQSRASGFYVVCLEALQVFEDGSKPEEETQVPSVVIVGCCRASEVVP